MKIKIIAVGSLKESYLRAAAGEYIKRLKAYFELEIVEIGEARLPDRPSEKEIEAALSKEADAIAKKIPPRYALAVLSIEGGGLSSEGFSDLIRESSAAGLCFVIGGSYGLAERLKQKADHNLSFSKMTFPHQLMRVILLEQLYRAGNIIAGGRYHK